MGPDRIFAPQGMLALMFLKSYVGCSDRKLISHLNGNIDFQMFCGIFLGPERISNYKIVSEIRCGLARSLDIKSLQQVLAESWKPYLTDTNIMMEDATCYETSMRYPTDVKLLWECTEWVYKQLKLVCKYLKISGINTIIIAISVGRPIKKLTRGSGVFYTCWRRLPGNSLIFRSSISQD